MIGALIKTAAMMGAYGAAGEFTKKAIPWASRRFATTFKTTVRSLDAYAYRKGLGTSAGNYASSLSTVMKAAEAGTSQIRAQSREALSKGSLYVKARYSKTTVNRLTRMKGAAMDELHFLPANYAMYRIEKHRAVTQEDKEATRSFSRYYAGTPMAVSLGAGYAMRKYEGLIGRIGNKVARSINNNLSQKSKRSIANVAISASAVGASLMEAGYARAMGVREAIGQSSMLKLVAHGSPIGQVIRNFKSDYVRSRNLHLRAPMLHGNRYLTNLDTHIKSFGEMEFSRIRNEISTNPALSPSQINSMMETSSMLVKKFAESQINDYDKYMKYRFRRTQKMMDTLYQNAPANDPLRLEQKKVAYNFSLGDKMQVEHKGAKYTFSADYTKNDMVAGISSYTLGGRDMNFGRFSFSFMKDTLVKGATSSGRNASRFMLQLFGVNDMVKQLDTEFVAGSAFTVVGKESGKMILPFAVDPTEISNPVDIIEKWVGAKPGSSGNSDAYKTQLNSLFHSRAKAYGIPEDNGDLLKDMFLKDARHATFRLRQGDVIVNHPGGSISLITPVRPPGGGKEERTMFTFAPKDASGKTIRFMKFSRADSAPVKLARRMFGSTTDSEGRIFGPTPDAEEMRGETRGVMGAIKRYLDLGRSEEKSALGTLMSVFTKHTDPRNPSTLFSSRYMGNPDWVSNLVQTDRSINDVLDTIRISARDSMVDFVESTQQKIGGNRVFVNGMREIEARMAHMDTNVEFFSNYLVSDIDTIGDARSYVLNFQKTLREKIGKNSEGKMFYDDTMSEVSRLLQLLPESKKASGVYSAMTAEQTNRYNALVLSTITGFKNRFEISEPNALMGIIGREPIHGFVTERAKPFIKTIKKAVSDSEISAFITSSHLSTMYHKAASEFSNISYSMALDARQGNADRIADILTNMTGHVDYREVMEYHTRGKHAPFRPFEPETSSIDFNDVDEITLVPKTLFSGFVKHKTIASGDSTVRIAQGMMDAANVATMSMFHAFNRASSYLGLGFSEADTVTPSEYFKKMLTKRVLPGAALYLGYSVTDRLADQYLDGTPFGEGLTVFGANLMAGARVAAAGFLDMTGVTGAAKYLEDLMPGSISSPLSGALRGIGPTIVGLSMGRKFGGPHGALTGGIIGSAVGALTGGLPLGVFGQWDISKTRKETIQELTGEREVAIRKGRWWELGSTPFEGTRISYFRPHMYSLMRSNYKETPGYKDSLLTEIAGSLAPDIYAMKNYYSRPYPETSGLFANIPVFGSISRMIPGVGTLLGGGMQMHEEDYGPEDLFKHATNTGISTPVIAGMMANRNGNYSMGEGGGFNYNDTNMFTESAMSRNSIEYGIGESAMNLKDIVGLRGFLIGTAFAGITGRADLFDYAPVMATAAEMSGVRRSYWDMELGGLLGGSEIIRRYIPHKRNQIEIFNPITNTMPNWMPGKDYYIDFRHGDPYTLVPMGEARLPGAGYEALKKVDLTMPVESEILGEDIDSQISFYLGLPEYMSTRNRQIDMVNPIAMDIVEKAKQYGDLVKASASVYNVEHDIHATVDAILRGSRGESIAVKVVPKGFAGQSSLNAFMVLSDVRKGMLITVDPENGGVTQSLVSQDMRMFENDISRNQIARQSAMGQLVEREKKGEAINLANSYSWVDRMRILGDIAPYSKEYKEAEKIVNLQTKAGRITDDQRRLVNTIKDQVDQRKPLMDFHEYRFLDQGMGVTTYSNAKRDFYLNEYNPLERTLGAAWEKFSHLRTPVHSKLLHHGSSLEEYEKSSVYGKQIKMWEHPIDDFVESYWYQMKAETDPLQSIVSWSTGGAIALGYPGVLIGGAIGAMQGVGNMLTGNALAGGVPERTSVRREITDQMHAVNYMKNQMLFQQTGDITYKRKAENSIVGYAMRGEMPFSGDIGNIVGGTDRYYLESILNNMTTENMDRVMKVVPEIAIPTVLGMAGKVEEGRSAMEAVRDKFIARDLPGVNSTIYSADVPIELPLITSLENEGINAHDAGQGWYSQIASMNRLQELGVYHGEDLYPNGMFESKIDITHFQKSLTNYGSIRNALSKYGTVVVSDDGQDRLDIEIIVSA